jgi:hypothetical protein
MNRTLKNENLKNRKFRLLLFKISCKMSLPTLPRSPVTKRSKDKGSLNSKNLSIESEAARAIAAPMFEGSVT